MKKRLATIILLAFTATSLVACGNSSNEAESTADTTIETEVATAEPTATPEPTEAPHEHTYAEEVTKEATCLEDGEKALTCVCGETDTRVAEGSMLTYTFEDMDATKYAKSTVNVRSLPNTDGEKLGGLSTNDEVKVTGKCAETGWYRIEYADSIAYVSDDYLIDEKVEVQAQSTSEPFPYELYKVYYNDALAWFYTDGSAGYSDTFWNAFNGAWEYNRNTMAC